MPRGEGRRAARAGRSAPERNRIVAARGARNSGTPQTSAERLRCEARRDAGLGFLIAPTYLREHMTKQGQ